MVITSDKREMTTGNNLLHGEGKGFQIYLIKFVVNRVRTGRVMNDARQRKLMVYTNNVI
jgi:hypothetical protein